MIQPIRDARLRVLHLISGDRWAGAEVQAFTLLKELSKSHDVFAIVLNEHELAQRLRDLDISVAIIDEAKFNAWQIFKRIRQILKSTKPDLVHTHRQKENILGSIANLLSIRAKCVRTVHGDSEFEPIGIAKFQATLDILCGRFLQDGIIAVSEDLQRKLEHRFPHRTLFTIENGLDPEEVRCNLLKPDFKKLMPDKKHIGIVGRLDTVKRIDIFLEMAEFLLHDKARIPWQFHVFGEGNLEAEMKQLSYASGIAGKVIFHGHRVDIKNCIYGLDAVVMCSDHEGLPMTALECLAIGTPMIAHRVGGLTNLLKEFPDRLVERHDAEHYATTLYNMISINPEKMNFPWNHTIEHTSKCMSSLYTKLLETVDKTV